LKESGKTFRSVYGRMKWDDIAPTLTTLCTGYGNGRYGHPVQDRAISLREAAIIQSFPESYEFIEPDKKVVHSSIETQIGNAVPVLLARTIAKSIKKHVKGISAKKQPNGEKNSTEKKHRRTRENTKRS
jgi:DNA (cytosine-5)-methyltransferase 1